MFVCVCVYLTGISFQKNTTKPNFSTVCQLLVNEIASGTTELCYICSSSVQFLPGAVNL